MSDWQHRAGRGVGIKGKHDTKTTYFWGQSSWGGPICGAPKPHKATPHHATRHHEKGKPGPGQSPGPKPKPKPTPKPGSPSASPSAEAVTAAAGDSGDAATVTGPVAVGLVVAPFGPLVAGLLRRRRRRRSFRRDRPGP